MNNLGNLKVADDIDYADYERNSIDTFGKNMLYKMGWKDNQPLKKDGPIKPIEFKPRNFGLGLGADPLETKTKDKKDKKSNFYGTKVKIISGKHKGLKGKLVDRDIGDINTYLKESKHLNVELKINKKIVKIESEYIKLRNKEKTSSDKTEIHEIDDQKKGSKSSNKRLLKWVHPNIMVRVISKNSKYYNCKGIIDDLIDLFTFSLVLDDRTAQTELTEEDVETYIPKLNGDVLILSGQHRGEIAKLIQRDKKEDKVTVQLHSDFSLIELSQDDVSAYMKVE